MAEYDLQLDGVLVPAAEILADALTRVSRSGFRVYVL